MTARPYPAELEDDVQLPSGRVTTYVLFARNLAFESRFSAADGITKIWKTLT